MIKRLAALFLTASTVTGCSASSPKTCMSLEQIRANSGCLHIFRDQVYHRGGRTLITLIRAELMLHSLFPSTHTSDPEKYLAPNYVADVCPRGAARSAADGDLSDSAPAPTASARCSPG